MAPPRRTVISATSSRGHSARPPRPNQSGAATDNPASSARRRDGPGGGVGGILRLPSRRHGGPLSHLSGTGFVRSAGRKCNRRGAEDAETAAEKAEGLSTN